MLKLGLMGRSIAFLSPLMIGSMLTSAPVEAATLSSARSNLTIRFNTAPTFVFTLTDTDANTNVVTGEATADSNAEAVADGVDQLFDNFAFANTSGQGTVYDADALGLAGAAGLFSVAANNPFSFNFDAALDLATDIDNPLIESAESVGVLGFAVIDVTGSDLSDPTTFATRLSSLASPFDLDLPILASFGLNGQLSTINPDFLNFLSGGSLTVIPSSIQFNTGGNSETGIATVGGSFSRQFTDQRTLAVIDTKSVRSNVRAVPAPSMLLGTLVSGGMMLWRRRRSAQLLR